MLGVVLLQWFKWAMFATVSDMQTLGPCFWCCLVRVRWYYWGWDMFWDEKLCLLSTCSLILKFRMWVLSFLFQPPSLQPAICGLAVSTTIKDSNFLEPWAQINSLFYKLPWSHCSITATGSNKPLNYVFYPCLIFY